MGRHQEWLRGTRKGWKELGSLGRLRGGVEGTGKSWKVPRGDGKLWEGLEGTRKVWKALGRSGRHQEGMEGTGKHWEELGRCGRHQEGLKGTGNGWKLSQAAKAAPACSDSSAGALIAAHQTVIIGAVIIGAALTPPQPSGGSGWSRGRILPSSPPLPELFWGSLGAAPAPGHLLIPRDEDPALRDGKSAPSPRGSLALQAAAPGEFPPGNCFDPGILFTEEFFLVGNFTLDRPWVRNWHREGSGSGCRRGFG